MAGQPATPKAARTVRNRRLRSFLFCHRLNLTDDWLLENQPQARANFQLAMYAMHLATGSTLKCQTIQSGTIKGYLHDVAKFLGRFRAINPRFVSATDTKLAPIIGKMIAEQKRWQTVQNRREPFTLEMQKAIANLPSATTNSCCLDAALANWTLCNLYAGCRGIEWAQTNCIHRTLHQFHKNRVGSAYAFTLQDVQCFTTVSCPVSIDQAVTNPSLVAKIKLRFEEQKKETMANGNCSPATIRTLVYASSQTFWPF